MVIKRREKPVHELYSITRENSLFLELLVEKRLIENKSSFVNKLIAKYAPVMLQNVSEIEETNLIIQDEDLIRQKSQEENQKEAYEKLSDEDKKLLQQLTNDMNCEGYVLSKFKKDYERFKLRGLIK